MFEICVLEKKKFKEKNEDDIFLNAMIKNIK